MAAAAGAENPLFKKNQIVRAGYLEKQSRHLKIYRKRWFVLTDDAHLYSFKDKNDVKPTETIDLRIFSSVKSSEDTTNRPNSFDVYSPDTTFSLVAETSKEKEDWIRAIGKAIVLCRPKRDE